MFNVVVGDDGQVLTAIQLAREANAIYKNGKKIFSPENYMGRSSRIGGRHCACRDGGMFKLSPITDEDVKKAGKRYMQCIYCGCWSHL